MQNNLGTGSTPSSGSTTLEVPVETPAVPLTPTASLATSTEPAPVSPLVTPQSVFGTSTTSIFNTPETGGPSSSTGTRLRTLGPRRSHFPTSASSATGGKSGGKNEAAVKEVDDPSTTPGNMSIFDKSQSATNTLTRLFAPQPAQSLFNKGIRNNSFQRGGGGFFLMEEGKC